MTNQVEDTAEFFRFAVNLESKFSRGNEDEADGTLALQQPRLVDDVQQHWPQEGGRLARPGLCDANDVTARQN